MVDLLAARSFVRRASGASVDGRGFATRTEEVMHFSVVGGSLLALWLRVQRVYRDVGLLCHCPICGKTGRRARADFPSASGPVTQRGRACNDESATRVQTDAAGGASAATGTRRKLSL